MNIFCYFYSFLNKSNFLGTIVNFEKEYKPPKKFDFCVEGVINKQN